MFIVDSSSIFPTNNRGIVDCFIPLFVISYLGSSICQSLKNNGVLRFRIYQKHSLPVNMAVDINKPEIHDKSFNL